ncbi:MAG TPA: hypothetical protein PLU87_11275 [Sedimentisphaerales bacterium]|nr:hypothetical protein [Sedimentisphaerales bacterium]HRS12025.1 hypothetical protein [Sedimentisphaerales bacterium]HRV48542.1 hypothetical protein [Sedimentisphaerales bacterium]
MLDRLIQLPGVAQGDVEGWSDLIVFLIVAAFWAVGALLKAVSARRAASQSQRPGRMKPTEVQKRESWQQRLSRKAEEIQRAAQEHVRKMEEQAGGVPSAERPREPRRPDRGRVTVRARPGGESVLVYERREPAETPQDKQRRAAELHRERQEEARRLRQQRREAAEKRLRVETPPIQPEPVSAADVAAVSPQAQEPEHDEPGLLDYSDPEALKRAVLHYEILGKPLSLRDPLEQQIPGL